MRNLINILSYFIKIPLYILYSIAVYLRNKLYDCKILKSEHFNFPIINVGNITVGGTGKTPHVEYLLSFLYNKYITATLSRGYKRKSKGFRYVNLGDTAYITGDEALQIKQNNKNIIVSLCENRAEGIKRLMYDNKNLQVIILDDAFQHRKIKAGLNIVLVDYNCPIYNDNLLPLGRLRDSKTQIKRAEIVIISKCPDNLQSTDFDNISRRMSLYPYQQLYFTTLEYGNIKSVFSNSNQPDILANKEKEVLAVTGIASPAIFINYVENHFGKTTALKYADHHTFTVSDMQQISKTAHDKYIVLTTEKDSMRLQQLTSIIPAELKKKLFYIPIRIRFLKDEDKFLNYINNYVRENKNNGKLYKK
jgi:tetraacyldisaccharide 4'-kinase